MPQHLPRFPRALVAAALTVAALAGCTAAPAATPTALATSAPTAELTGTVGAADFTNGYLTVGTGPTIVDSYFDLMCPYCEQFESANGAQLADLVASGSITLRLHPMVFLDRLSMGTEYSTRATNALVGVAVASPDAVLPYLRLLFENKPDENAVGLTDDVLASLALEASTGTAQTVALDQVLAARPYAAWSAGLTEVAMTEGGIVDAEITVVDRVPILLVNGHLYPGELMDAAAFAAFVAAN